MLNETLFDQLRTRYSNNVKEIHSLRERIVSQLTWKQYNKVRLDWENFNQVSKSSKLRKMNDLMTTLIYENRRLSIRIDSMFLAIDNESKVG